MWYQQTEMFKKLRARIVDIPVIETHEHHVGICTSDEDLNLEINYINWKSLCLPDCSCEEGLGLIRKLREGKVQHGVHCEGEEREMKTITRVKRIIHYGTTIRI